MECVLESKAATILEFIQGLRGTLAVTFEEGTMVGQDVQIRPGMVSSSGGTTTVTTDLVRLWPSQITGQVGNINNDSGTFTLTGLSPLFTGATPPVTTINVVTLSGMDFMRGPVVAYVSLRSIASHSASRVLSVAHTPA